MAYLLMTLSKQLKRKQLSLIVEKDLQILD